MKAGDLVECIDVSNLRNHKIVVGEIYEISYLDGQYVHLEGVTEPGGGFLPFRFIPAHTGMDASEYDDIMAGQEIYEELRDV